MGWITGYYEIPTTKKKRIYTLDLEILQNEGGEALIVFMKKEWGFIDIHEDELYQHVLETEEFKLLKEFSINELGKKDNLSHTKKKLLENGDKLIESLTPKEQNRFDRYLVNMIEHPDIQTIDDKENIMSFLYDNILLEENDPFCSLKFNPEKIVKDVKFIYFIDLETYVLKEEIYNHNTTNNAVRLIQDYIRYCLEDWTYYVTKNCWLN